MRYCHYCKEPFVSNRFMTRDHVIPRSETPKFLRNSLSRPRIVKACHDCNSCRCSIPYEKWLLISRLGLYLDIYKVPRRKKIRWYRQIKKCSTEALVKRLQDFIQ